jgi:hypothetical protein
MRIRSVLLALSGMALLVGLTGCSTGVAPGDTEHIDLFAVNYDIAPSGVVHVTETIKCDFANVADRRGIQRFLDSHFVDTASQDRVYKYSDFRATSPTHASALLSTATQETCSSRSATRTPRSAASRPTC